MIVINAIITLHIRYFQLQRPVLFVFFCTGTTDRLDPPRSLPTEFFSMEKDIAGIIKIFIIDTAV